jgi:hypothetical protein
MKKNTSKLFLAIFAIIIVVVIAVFAYISIIDKPNDPAVTPTPSATIEPNENKLDVVNYTVYSFDDLKFNFIIAKFRVKANSKSELLDLDNYVTEENNSLGDIADFNSILELNGYYLGKQNVYYELSTSDSNYFVNLFIPVNNKELSKISLTNTVTADSYTFDLTDITGSKENLHYEANDVITNGSTYILTVSSAEQLAPEGFTRTFTDGTVLDNVIPSTAEIFAFEIVASSLNEDIVIIDSATYEVEESNDEFEALDSEYKNIYYNNIIGSLITDDSKGYVFLITLNPEKEKITYKGILKIQIQGEINPIQIDVDLQ